MARPWTAALLFHASFILLSGASSEPRRCYWCGPLAEQVHRSQRSAPCGASDYVTVCEPGYNYCAVVATSPPRVESRYCVKIYQDECYPLYCNSTKTWKMTCPCRGDLCNGPNTERENEAFALLPKLVAKTHNARIKKRTANAAPHLIKHGSKIKIIANGDAEIHNMPILSSGKIDHTLTNDNRLIVTENDGNLDQKSGYLQSDQTTNQPVMVEHHNEGNYQSTIASQDNFQTSTINNQLIEIVIHVSDPTEKSMKENEQLCTDSPTTTESNEASKHTDTIEVESQPAIATTAQSLSNTETSMKTTENINIVESETLKTIETVLQSPTDTKPTDKSPQEIMQNDQPMNPMDEMQNDAPLISPTDTLRPLNTTEVIKSDEPPTEDVKSSDGMPTAEALQQNGSPSLSLTPSPVTEKSTEPTITEATTIPTIMTTQHQITTIMPTTPASRRKNNALRIRISFTLLLICVVCL